MNTLIVLSFLTLKILTSCLLSVNGTKMQVMSAEELRKTGSSNTKIPKNNADL